MERHLERVLLDELLLDPEQVRGDERDHGAFDRRPLRVRTLSALVVCLDEFRRAS